MKKFMAYLATVVFVAAMVISGPSTRVAARAAAATPAQWGGGPPPGPPPGNEPWAVPNSRWQAVQQRGYRDGVTGARRDAQNHRQPNPNNRDEFRNPPVSGRDRNAYRDGFRQGYWNAARHLMGGYYRGPWGE